MQVIQMVYIPIMRIEPVSYLMLQHVQTKEELPLDFDHEPPHMEQREETPCEQREETPCQPELQKRIPSVAEVLELFTQEKTTVMIKNIPLSYSSEEFLADVKLQDFHDTFDFFYLPVDFKTKKNRGYGFVNFLSNEIAKNFISKLHGQRLSKHSTNKILEMSPAQKQGRKDNMTNLKRAELRVKNRWFRPRAYVGDESEQN